MRGADARPDGWLDQLAASIGKNPLFCLMALLPETSAGRSVAESIVEFSGRAVETEHIMHAARNPSAARKAFLEEVRAPTCGVAKRWANTLVYTVESSIVFVTCKLLSTYFEGHNGSNRMLVFTNLCDTVQFLGHDRTFYLTARLMTSYGLVAQPGEEWWLWPDMVWRDD